jgi:hypothetical protein
MYKNDKKYISSRMGKKHLEPFINLDVKKGTVRTYRYKNYSQNWEKITILTSIYKNCTSQN